MNIDIFYFLIIIFTALLFIIYMKNMKKVDKQIQVLDDRYWSLTKEKTLEDKLIDEGFVYNCVASDRRVYDKGSIQVTLLIYRKRYIVQNVYTKKDIIGVLCSKQLFKDIAYLEKGNK